MGHARTYLFHETQRHLVRPIPCRALCRRVLRPFPGPLIFYLMKSSNLPSHAVRSRQFYFGKMPDSVGIAYVGTLAECQEFIRADGENIYRTAHNEAARWRLRIVTTASLSPYAIMQAENAQQERAYHEACFSY